MKYTFLTLFIVLSLMSIVSAEPSFTVEQNSITDLKISCFDINNTVCTSATPCRITVHYPNLTNMISDKNMTFTTPYYNYTLNTNNTAVKGEYQTIVTCEGQVEDGFSVFTYLVNPTGIRPSAERVGTLGRGIWIIAAFGLVSLFGFIFIQQPPAAKYAMLILSFTFWLIAINITFVSITDEIVNPNLETFFDFFTAASFYMYWFFGALFIFLMIIGFFQNVVYKQNMRKFENFGGEFK